MNIENLQYPTIDLVATGERIKELRKARGFTVMDLSRFMGFTEPQAVYKWQRGESLPTVDNLYALSRILRTSMEDILVGYDEMSSRFLCTTIHPHSPYHIPRRYFYGASGRYSCVFHMCILESMLCLLTGKHSLGGVRTAGTIRFSR